MKLYKAAMEVNSADAGAQSTDQTRTHGQGIMDLMSSQATQLAQDAVSGYADQLAANKEIDTAKTNVIQTAESKSANTANLILSARVQAHRSDLNLFMNVTSAVLGLSPSDTTVADTVRTLDSNIESLLDNAVSARTLQLLNYGVSEDRLVQFTDQMQSQIENVYASTVENGKRDLNKETIRQKKISKELVAIESKTSNLYSSSDNVLSALTDIETSALTEILSLSKQIADFKFSISPDDSILRILANDRKDALIKAERNFDDRARDEFDKATNREFDEKLTGEMGKALIKY